MVLCSQVGLYTLAERCSSVVNVLPGHITTNERDGLDGGVVADSVDGVGASVHADTSALSCPDHRGCVRPSSHVEHSWRHTGPLAQLGDDHGRSRVALRWLHDQRVTLEVSLIAWEDVMRSAHQ